MSDSVQIAHYFVDEAGDLSFFDKKGRVIVGQPGASRYFMLGVAHITEPDKVAVELEALRSSLMQEPRYQNIPSMQVEAKKTAIAFHAKDDHSEIREKVFELIQSFDVKVFVALRCKSLMADAAKAKFQNLGRKIEQNAIYDDLITRLFKYKLHKADRSQITIARRGKESREEALEKAISKARENFNNTWKVNSDRPILIRSAYPSEIAGLQVIDYYLWAIQRLYERKEDKFFQLLAPKYRLIMDIDDRRNKNYGEWYCDRNPLTLEKIREARSK